MYRELANQYRGLVVEQFRCPDGLRIATDAVARNRLFYLVVESDRAATEILKRLNRSQLPGTVNFYAMNRLRRKGEVDIGPYADVATEMMIPFEDSIKPGMGVVVEQIFGRVLLCQDLPTALATSMDVLDDRKSLLKAQMGERGDFFFNQLAQDHLNNYSKLNAKGLEREIASVKERLKGFDGVNQRAAIEAMRHEERLSDLQAKLLRFTEQGERCRELVATVDTQKDDALQYTLKTVANHFKETVRAIAQTGTGHVKWIYDGSILCILHHKWL